MEAATAPEEKEQVMLNQSLEACRPQIYVHPEPQNVTLGIKVFVYVIKVKIFR